jgi:hypothetical protein
MRRNESRSNVFGAWHRPVTSTVQPSVLKFFDAAATPSLFVVNS